MTTTAIAVTDEMVEAGVQHYSEGGCSGLTDYERREVVQAILEAALSLQGTEPFAWYWYDASGCLFITGDGRKPDVPADAKPLFTAPPTAKRGEVGMPAPETHVAGSLWDQLVVLSGYHITRPPTPDHEFVQVCNGDLRKMVELMGGGSSPSSNAAGRWRAFEDTTPGYWGIELEDAGNDDDAILYPQKIHRDTVARIVEAHNASLATPSPLPMAAVTSTHEQEGSE